MFSIVSVVLVCINSSVVFRIVYSGVVVVWIDAVTGLVVSVVVGVVFVTVVCVGIIVELQKKYFVVKFLMIF